MIAPLPPDEPARVAALRAYHLLDTPPEPAFDDLTRLAAFVCGTPMAVVSLIDADRQWFKAKVGIDGEQTDRREAFCAHTILGTDLLEVPDATADVRFQDNPHVTGGPLIRFYAGMPLTCPEGHALGSLCVVDRRPRALTPEQADALRVLGRQAVAQMVLRRQVSRLEQAAEETRRYEDQLLAYQGQLEAANARLAAEATTDGLTGVRNRAAFDARLAELFALAVRHDRPLSVLLLDVDHFKAFNDTFGHPAGDAVLRAVAGALAGTARGTDTVARYGGEEFAVLLPDTDAAGAAVLGERCRRAVARAAWDRRPVTVSVGAATLTPDTADAAALVRAADEALYRSKRAGRNRVTAASGPAMATAAGAAGRG